MTENGVEKLYETVVVGEEETSVQAVTTTDLNFLQNDSHESSDSGNSFSSEENFEQFLPPFNDSNKPVLVLENDPTMILADDPGADLIELQTVSPGVEEILYEFDYLPPIPALDINLDTVSLNEAVALAQNVTKPSVKIVESKSVPKKAEVKKSIQVPTVTFIKVINGDEIYLIEKDENNADKDVQCTNCDSFFTDKEFLSHVCHYDENQELIPEENSEPSISFESEVIGLFRHTGEMQRTFLREQCKITVTRPYHKHKDHGPHFCKFCGRKFNYESTLQRHLEKHKSEFKINDPVDPVQTVIKCLVCGEVFSEIKYGHEHYEDKHAKAGEVFDPKKYLKLVMVTTILKCEFCNSVFTKVGDLFHHTSVAHCPSEGYRCDLCQISVLTLKEIQQHWQQECVYVKFEPSRRIKLVHFYACNVCDETFSQVDVLYSHRNASHHLFPRVNHDNGKIQINCEVCGGLFQTASEFFNHQIDHNVRKPTIQRKRNTSVKPRPHLCEICGKSYTQSSHLWQHLRFHQGVKPFQCPEKGCDRKFTIRPDLNDHIRKCHTGERPFHCLLCGKRFLTGSVFYQHRLIHRGERRHECSECGRKFYRADALKNHSRIHTGEKPYPCPHCPKSFRQRGDREKHVRARHKFLPPPNVSTNSFPIDFDPPKKGRKPKKGK